MIDLCPLTICLPFRGESSPKIAISPHLIPLFGAPHSPLPILHILKKKTVVYLLTSSVLHVWINPRAHPLARVMSYSPTG